MEGITRGAKITIWGVTSFMAFPLARQVIHPTYRHDIKSKGKAAIVTGATGNLGSAIAFQLAKRDLRVIMACRDMEKCRMTRREIVLRTGNKSIVCRHLDLEDIDSINRFAKEMKDTEPHIDVLINNAAVKEVKEKELTKYGIEKNYFVNFLAPFLLTFLLMDKLKEASLSTRDSRIINVIGNPKSSWDVDVDDVNFDKRKYNPKTAYNQSKMALAYFTILLDKYHRDQKNLIWVYGTSPGAHKIMKLNADTGLWSALKSIAEGWYKMHPERIICPVVKCAVEPKLAHQSRSGRLYCYFLTSFGWGKAGKDENKAKIVWNSATKLLLAPK